MAEHPLALKLASFIDLTAAERKQIDAWSCRPTSIPARQTLIRQGVPTGPTCMMLSGWAYRYKDLRRGSRQIVGLLLPGDTCDLHGFLLRTTDHGIAILSDAKVAMITRAEMEGGLQANPRLTDALWWSTLVDECITREWLVNTGLRNAAERVAHLFCEVWFRADCVGLAAADTLTLPLTQTELGEVLGLTSVHIDRTLKTLRERGLATFQGRRLMIPSIDRLGVFAEFDPTYLQLERRSDQG